MSLTLRGALVLVAAVVGAGVTARLGVWQLDRADQKTRLQQAQLERRALPPLPETELAPAVDGVAAQLHRAVVVRGRWLAAHTVYLENRQMNGRPGFFAVTPLQLGDGSAVLVQRGWVARDADDRIRIRLPPLPAGAVELQGRIAPGPSRLYEFTGAASGPIRQNLDIDAFARESGLRLRPLTIVQEDGAAPLQDGLLRQWPQPAADVQKNYGYAFQWFAMSTLIIGLYVWFKLLRPRRARRS